MQSWLKVKGWKRYTMLTLIKRELAVLISNKVDRRTKNVTRMKKYHFIMTAGFIDQEDLRVLNIYTLNNRASKYLKQKQNCK